MLLECFCLLLFLPNALLFFIVTATVLGHRVVIILLVLLISLAFAFGEGRRSRQTLLQLLMERLSVLVDAFLRNFLLFLLFGCSWGCTLLHRKLPVTFHGGGIGRIFSCGHRRCVSTFELGMDSYVRIFIIRRRWRLTSPVFFVLLFFFTRRTCIRLLFTFRLHLHSRKRTVSLLSTSIAFALST